MSQEQARLEYVHRWIANANHFNRPPSFIVICSKTGKAHEFGDLLIWARRKEKRLWIPCIECRGKIRIPENKEITEQINTNM